MRKTERVSEQNGTCGSERGDPLVHSNPDIEWRVESVRTRQTMKEGGWSANSETNEA